MARVSHAPVRCRLYAVRRFRENAVRGLTRRRNALKNLDKLKQAIAGQAEASATSGGGLQPADPHDEDDGWYANHH